MILETENPEIIEIYNDYLLVKKYIKVLTDLRDKLVEEKTIIKKPSYFVFYGKKSSYNEGLKLLKHIVFFMIGDFKKILSIFNKYNYLYFNLGTKTINRISGTYIYNIYDFGDLGTFEKLLLELKKILRLLIIYKHQNKEIPKFE